MFLKVIAALCFRLYNCFLTVFAELQVLQFVLQQCYMIFKKQTLHMSVLENWKLCWAKVTFTNTQNISKQSFEKSCEAVPVFEAAPDIPRKDDRSLRHRYSLAVLSFDSHRLPGSGAGYWKTYFSISCQFQNCGHVWACIWNTLHKLWSIFRLTLMHAVFAGTPWASLICMRSFICSLRLLWTDLQSVFLRQDLSLAPSITVWH